MTMHRRTSSIRRREIITGLFFIMATTTAIIGLGLYQPVLLASDPIAAASAHANDIALGAFFEALLAIANIGTAFMMMPVLSNVSERLGPAYAIFRSLEVVLILGGLVSMLALASVAQQFTFAAGADQATYSAIASTLIAMHDWTFIMGPHFMLGVNTLIYSYLFLRSGLMPRAFAMTGIAGAILIFIAAVLEIFGVITPYSTTIIFMALPIAIYEMVLAGRLIRKGFNPQHRVTRT